MSSATKVVDKTNKQWSLKDSNFAWRGAKAGVPNHQLAIELGRTPVAIGIHLSNMKTKKARQVHPKVMVKTSHVVSVASVLFGMVLGGLLTLVVS